MVTWDEGAEGVFRELGREGNLPMLTTTVGRLAECGAVDAPGCWSVYGRDAVIG
jgi:hypothetical protein